jgi:hypothetical protein
VVPTGPDDPVPQELQERDRPEKISCQCAAKAEIHEAFREAVQIPTLQKTSKTRIFK